MAASTPTSSSAPAADAARARRKRHPVLRWIRIVLAVLLAFVLVSELLGWRYLRGPIERYASDSLGVPVRVGAPFRLHLLRPPQASAGSLWVAAAPGSQAPFLVDAQSVLLRWRWGDINAFRKGEALRIVALQADRLEAHVLRTKDGQASWQFKTDPNEPKTERDPPKVERVRLREAAIHVDDAVSQVKVEAHARMNESAPRAGQPAASAPAGDAAAQGDFGLVADAQGTYRGMPIKVEARSPQVLPLLDEDQPAPLQVKVEALIGRARLAYDGVVHDPLGARGIEGEVRLSGPSLGAVGEALNVTLPTTPPFNLRGTLRHTDPVWHVAVASATIGKSALRGEFAYDPQPGTPKLTGTLAGRRLDLADLAPAVGADGKPSTPPPNTRNGGPRVIPDRSFDLPSLKAMDADVRVALDELNLNTSAVETLRPLAGRIVLDGGVLRITELQATTAGGSVTGSTGLDSNAKPPRWDTDLRLRGVDLAGWLKGARKDTSDVNARSSATKLKREREAARSGDEPVTAYITGELQAEIKLRGQGNSTAQLLSTLDGSARAVVRNGTLSHLIVEALGIDVAQALGVFVKGDASLPLNCAVVAMDAKQGVLTPSVAVLDTRDSTVTLSGTIDLKNELLDLRSETKPKDFSFATLRSPLLLTGSFSSPDVGVAPGPIAARVAAGAALAAVAGPLAALLPLLDPGSGDKEDNCQALVQQSDPAKAAPAKAAKSRP
ncbi:AsmA family protein [Aquincola tertiaricarbonis]|uniref:AsmA family protein n=1 Tax=Aquincola tertiaricarbonis TaxID=391953 RepID=UPI000614CC09|nr:AsmA family protein [Aquincola tertiaricarbonis]